MNLDFGYTGDKSGDNNANPNANGNTSDTTDLTTGKPASAVNGEPADDINSISDSGDSVNNKKPVSGVNTPAFENGDTNNNDDSKKEDESVVKDADNKTQTDVELVEGSVLEVGEDKYTVDAAGNLVDKGGNIFKEAKDVKDWIASFDKIDDGAEGALSIDTIQDVVGIEITDENDAPIVFDNTPQGVKAYIDAVAEANRDEHYEEAINTLYQKYPILPDILNYYVANGNSLEGFNQVQDRSEITIDDSNEAQQESIIRTAWSEQGRKGDVESYIQYLKSSGTLLPVSKEELVGLQDLDKQTKEQLAEKAQEAEDLRIQNLEKYWNGVKEVISNKSIAGYQIPDTIIINKGGKKLSATPNDFYNYVYQLDKDGKSAYEKDLATEDPNNRRDDELLRAYLKFVGGNYSNLVGMAVNKDKVNTLRLQAKNRTASSVKINKPKADVAKGEKTDFGY